MSGPNSRSPLWRDREFWQDANNHTHESILRETKLLQDQSLTAVERIRCQVVMINDVGKETLSELRDQEAHLESTESNICELSDNLDAASKLQDRFGMLAFLFGTKRKARKEVNREEKRKLKAEKSKVAAVATFKRKGRRLKKKSSAGNREIIQDEKRNDNENLSNARLQSKSGKAKNQTTRDPPSPNTTIASKEEPLSEKDRRDLRDIEDTDALIDKGIDALGVEFKGLLNLSKSMNETVNRQNDRLETIETGLETTKTKTKLLNKRLKLLKKKR